LLALDLDRTQERAMSQRPGGVTPQEPGAWFPFNAREAELVRGLDLQRFPLFLTGLVYRYPDGELVRAYAVATRDGYLVAHDDGEPFQLRDRVPPSRLFDDEDFLSRSVVTRREALSDLNRVFLANEVGAATRGRRSVNEVAERLVRGWFASEAPTLAVEHGEVLGVWPLEITTRLRDTISGQAGKPGRGEMVEEVLQLLVP
jgi:hypothetical protein